MDALKNADHPQKPQGYLLFPKQNPGQNPGPPKPPGGRKRLLARLARWLDGLRGRLSRLPGLFGFWDAGEVHYIGGSDVLPAPLTREEEESLVQNLRADSGAIRTKLIEHNLRLVVYIARRFENTGVGLEDLISIGTIGLIKAVNTFDPVKRIKLATYASRCIENEILMHLRRTSRLRLEVSFDEPLNTDWDGNELLLSDILGTESDMVYRQIEEGVEKQLLESALTRLNLREQRIMKLRFGLGGGKERTQKEVADILGISQSYISRLEKRILFRLKKELARMA